MMDRRVRRVGLVLCNLVIGHNATSWDFVIHKLTLLVSVYITELWDRIDLAKQLDSTEKQS